MDALSELWGEANIGEGRKVELSKLLAQSPRQRSDEHLSGDLSLHQQRHDTSADVVIRGGNLQFVLFHQPGNNRRCLA
jgi:hypothetical protein